MPSADNLLKQAQQNIYKNDVGKDASPGGGAVPYFNYKPLDSSDMNKYKVQGLSYPEDLMSNSSEHGDNVAIFYINVSNDSKIFKNGQSVTTVPVQRNERGGLLGQNITSQQAIAGTTGTAAAAGAITGKLTGLKTTGLATGTAAATAALITDSANNAEVPAGEQKPLTFTRPQRRLEAAIALYVPNQMSVRYSVSWGEEDTFALSAAAKGAGEIARAAEDRKLGPLSKIAKEVATNRALEKGPMGRDLGIAAGLAANPKKEQAFKNVDFRTFTFEYQFSPRNETEAQNALNIIRAFKYHMHPEFTSSDQFLYVYPSEFDIVYYKGQKENLNLHRHTSCVLTEMNVNYTPNGVFSTFPNGMPTQINLTLTFRELMLLTKESIERYT